MTRVILLFLLVSLGSSSIAQVSIGNRGGVSMFKTGFSGGDDDDRLNDLRKNSLSTIGISIALPIEMMLTDHFGLQPEIGYTMKGKSYEGLQQSSRTTKLNYLDFTLLAKGRIGPGKFQGEVMLGPGIAAGITVREITRGSYWYPFSNSTADFADTFLTRTELFLTGGAGFSFAFGAPRIFINYRYVYGITNIYDESIPFVDINGELISRVKEYNRGSIISLGFLVPLSKSAWVPAEISN